MIFPLNWSLMVDFPLLPFDYGRVMGFMLVYKLV